jgi:hypothetical protein
MTTYVRDRSKRKCPFCGKIVEEIHLRYHLLKSHEADLVERTLRECFNETVDIVVGEAEEVDSGLKKVQNTRGNE